MATIIDELIITLGLDAKDFTAGQKQAAQSIVDLRTHLSDSVNEMGSTLMGFAGKLSAFFLGFEGLKGVIDLVKNTAYEFKQLGISAQLLGTSVRELRTLQEFSQLAGGAPGDAASFASNLRMQMAGMLFSRIPQQFLPTLVGLDPRALAGMSPEAQLKAMQQATLSHGSQLARMLSGLIPGITPQVAEGIFGQFAGFSPALAAENANPQHFQQDLAKATQTNRKVTDQTAENAKRAADALIDLKYKAENAATIGFGPLITATNLLETAFADLAQLLADFEASPFGQFIKKMFAPLDANMQAIVNRGVEYNAVHPGKVFGPVGHALGAAGHGIADFFGFGAPPSISDLHTFPMLPRMHPTPAVTASLIGPGSNNNSYAIGSINVNTRATDAAGIAAAMRAEIQRKFDVTQADSGMVA